MSVVRSFPPPERQFPATLARLGCSALLTGAALLAALPAHANALLFDFGADATQTTGGPTGELLYWNNVPNGIGADDFGTLFNLVLTDGNLTEMSLLMVSRFNGANESGTTAAPDYPASATRDSLFGNTELFSGLENITPIFKLSGLNPAATYTLTFYASRLGVGDNRETRYTVTGATETFADLDAANNVANTVNVSGMAPDVAGEITIALTPGPNNNNANHFTYLGVLRVDPVNPPGPGMLFDFGSANSLTLEQTTPAGPAWNNVTAAVGADDSGVLAGLVATNHAPSGISLRMVSRFNGANLNGSQAAGGFPVSATRDSLFGNTEPFNGLADVAPVFKFTGLNKSGFHTFTFHASREGVNDNRETRYTVTGANTAVADLNAANNVDGTAVVAGVRPDPQGEITVALTPGPNNDNGNHFTYLGLLRLDWLIHPAVAPSLSLPIAEAGRLRLELLGSPGHTYQVQQSPDLDDWATVQHITLDGSAAEIEVGLDEAARFLRVIE